MRSFKLLEKIIQVALILAATTALAGAPIELVGSHKGKIRGISKWDSHMDLIIRPIELRAGSYLGILIQAETKLLGNYEPHRVGLYLIDPVAGSTRYVMTPLNVTEDQYIGVNNADPSLVLDIIGQSDSKPKFQIFTANSSNHEGFKLTMEFEGSDSDVQWIDAQPGSYKLLGSGSRKTALTISAPDADNQASATFTTNGNSFEGAYLIQEKQPGLNVLRSVSFEKDGVKADSVSRRIAFWLKEGKDVYFVMVNPQNDKQIAILERK